MVAFLRSDWTKHRLATFRKYINSTWFFVFAVTSLQNLRRSRAMTDHQVCSLDQKGVRIVTKNGRNITLLRDVCQGALVV